MVDSQARYNPHAGICKHEAQILWNAKMGVMQGRIFLDTFFLSRNATRIARGLVKVDMWLPSDKYAAK